MRIIIIGAGEAGYHIAQNLSKKNDVVVIEKQKDVYELVEELDVQSIHGNGADINVLQSAGVADTGLLVAVTGVDEINILACMAAKLLSKNIKTIARVSSPDYINKPVDSREQLGMDAMICPELSLAHEIAKVILVPCAVNIEDLVGGKVEMMEFEAKNNSITGKKLKDGRLPDCCIITGIFRGGKLLIPHGEDVIQPDDKVFVVGKTEAIDTMRASFGKLKNKDEKILIVGGGNVGYYLLKELTKANHNITLIETSKKRCSELAELFPNVLVINGDGTDLKLLKEENLSAMTAVVAVTNKDEKNLLCSLLAKELGARKVISRADHPEYATLFEMVGIDMAINPLIATVNEVAKFTMRIGVEDLINLEGEKANIIELTAKKGSKIINKQLSDVNFPRNAIISAIVKDNDVIVPSGKHTIEPGDKVVIFSLPDAIEKVEKLFK
ncbi:MAG: Trk system potassium transporter TrkA [Methanosarcinales archaeon]|uniref:Trk system potassium transporter TrkA n=1 Tax=Candidatus Ethanoperedens thermophilum TaxID=2766897 RepID=A0A848D8W5_9EURY|nr:Trk system potassium transporter TrkA [Candidatus Ethanoperedens thermophilum]